MRSSVLFLSLAAAAFAAPAPQNGNRGKQNNAAAGNNAAGSANSAGDPQGSLTLDPKVIATGFANNGQEVQEEGQVPSLTSSNNFINFCLTQPNLPITNGKQVQTGSCNPAPMGVLPNTDNMPTSKFIFPKNGAVIQTGEIFTITMAVKNIELGNFVNAQENYFAAPQHLNDGGQIIGHTHVTIDPIASFNDTTPTDPKGFAYFKGVNTPAQNGVASVTVDKGLPAGVYRLASINAAANHQPVLVPIAQHGSLDDMVYFTVADDPASVADGFPDTAGAGANNAQTGAAAGTAAGNGQGAGAATGTGAQTGTGAGNGQGTGAATGAGAQTSTATGNAQGQNGQQGQQSTQGQTQGQGQGGRPGQGRQGGFGGFGNPRKNFGF